MTSALNMIPTYSSVAIKPGRWEGTLTDDEVGAAATLLWTCGHDSHDSCYGAMACATQELLNRVLAEQETAKVASTSGEES